MRLSIVALLLSAAPLFAADSIPVPADYSPPFTPSERNLEGLRITIDPGHGGAAFSSGYSGSARGVDSRVFEGDLNMRVAGLVFYHLRQAGATVHMTRHDDRKVTLGASGRSEELGARTALAEETKSHLFLSLHHNAAGRETADGVMILVWTKDKAGNEQPLEIAFGNILREDVEKHVHHSEPFDLWESDHPLVSGSDIPSAVVEFGFLTNPEFDAWVNRPTAHEEEALGIYDAVSRMWKEHRTELEELNGRLFPSDESTDNETASKTDETFPLGRPNSSIWPYDRLVETPAEAGQIVANFKAQKMTDRTTFYLDAKARREDDEWVLSGSANLVRLSEGLAAEFSKATGQRVRNEIEQLPSKALGGDLFGVAQIPAALTHVSPSERSGVQTQLLFGEPLFLLDVTESRDYYLVQGSDGYTGWVRADAVAPLSRDRFADYMQGRLARVTTDLMVGDMRIVPGSFLSVRESEKGLVADRFWSGTDSKKGETVKEPLAVKGEPFIVPENALLETDTTPGMRAAQKAMSMLRTPYVFAGRSSQGLDCSGLVGVSWATVGSTLPRDANQQAITGRLVGTSWFTEALAPGDALFFLDETGRVYHTGIFIGDGRFVHSSPPEVQINSFDKNDPLYSEGWHKAFAIARRPME